MVTHRILGSQLGSYFGAEVCVLKRPGDEHAALLLIGAPSFHDQGVGGEVQVCSLEHGVPSCTHSLRGAAGNELGRFGASLSPCPDLDGDGWPELAVGAPLENGGQGSMYIFLGRPGGLHTKYSQRVQGVKGASGLKFFGLSVHSAGDMSSDGLADLVVGAKGAAVILRSQPVMRMNVSVTLDPPIILQDYFHCAGAQALNTPVSTATVCVTVRGIHTGNVQAPLRAIVKMSVELDAQTRPARLLFYPSLPSSPWAGEVNGIACHNLSITIPGCISDYRPVPLSGRVSVEGQEVPDTEGLQSVLSPDSPRSFTHMVVLEKVCGEDNVCVPDLQVSVNFTSPEVISSPGFPVELAVEVRNSGEDASGTNLTVMHPSSISFHRAKRSLGQVPVWCVFNTTEFENVTQTVCRLSSTPLRQGSKMKVLVSFTVSDTSSLTKSLSVNASVTTNNEELHTLQDNFANSSVAVKLPINIIIRGGDSTQFIRFPESTLMEHTFVVENIGDMTALVNVTFVVPVKLTSGHQWNVTLLKTNSRGPCVTKLFSKKDKVPVVNENCHGVTCLVIGCTIRQSAYHQSSNFMFFGNISGETARSGVQVEVASWGVLSFERGVYAQYPPDGFQSLRIVSFLETPSPSRVGLIISLTVLCCLLVLLIIFGVLYKIGFFKHQTPPGGLEENAAAPSPEPSIETASLTETIL